MFDAVFFLPINLVKRIFRGPSGLRVS